MPLARDRREGARPEPRELALGRILEQTHDAIVVTSLDGSILLWSPAAATLFGYGEAEASSLNLVDLLPETPRGSLAPMAATGRPLEVAARHRDGHPLWIDLSLSLLRERGESFLLVIMRDATARVRFQTEQTRERDRLQSTNESLEAFAYVVSHDLKEPVRAMGFYLEEIEATQDATERAELVRRARDAQESLTRLMQGLLEWSRTAMAPVEPRVLKLHRVLRDPGCAAQYANLLQERAATLDISQEIPPIFATESLLCRVFGNLITNAIRHNPAPAPRVVIHADETAPMGYARIYVDDNGPGFPEKVKERFANLRNRPTTLRGGFGLAITRRAIERLSGSIELDDAPGGGGRVVVHLPLPPPPPRPSTIEQRVRELV